MRVSDSVVDSFHEIESKVDIDFFIQLLNRFEKAAIIRISMAHPKHNEELITLIRKLGRTNLILRGVNILQIPFKKDFRLIDSFNIGLIDKRNIELT
jgi:hypothetical protein